MPVPTYDKFIEPILRYLAANPEGALARNVHEAAATALNLDEADLQEMLPSGAQLAYKNRAGWAHDRLKRSGLSSSPKRGFWRLTEAGFQFVSENQSPLTAEQVDQLASANLTIRLREDAVEKQVVSNVESSKDSATKTPDDRLGEAINEIRNSVATEILETLGEVTPQFFERVVLEVLHQMGYGASRADLQQVGGSGDGGIDGIISLDKLGLEKVYVQAKRWKDSVGGPVVQGFYGALAGQRARKGVLITTSTFTHQAIAFAKSVEGIVLVDGPRLAQLMIDHGVGVTLKSMYIPRFDSDFFEND